MTRAAQNKQSCASASLAPASLQPRAPDCEYEVRTAGPSTGKKTAPWRGKTEKTIAAYATFLIRVRENTDPCLKLLCVLPRTEARAKAEIAMP